MAFPFQFTQLKLPGILSKQTVQFQIYFAYDGRKIFNAFYKIELVHVDGQHLAMLILRDPFLVMFVECSQVL